MHSLKLFYRLRPPEEEFDASFITVGDMIEVRRPNEKKTRKWHLARVLDLDIEEQHAVSIQLLWHLQSQMDCIVLLFSQSN